MEIIHNLELTRLKSENESKIGLAKQRMLVKEAGKGETAEECLKLRREVEEMREECQERVRIAREKREEELRVQLKAFKTELQAKRDKEETRIQREY